MKTFVQFFLLIGFSLSGQVILVHHSNPIDTLSIEQLKRIYLGKVTQWDNGKHILVYNLPDEHQIRIQFSHKFLGLSPIKVRQYWIKQILRYGKRRPEEFETEELILDMLKLNPNGIAYTCTTKKISKELKILIIRDE